MVDIELVRKNPDDFKRAVEAKQLDPSIIDQVLEFDKQWRTQLKVIEELRRERNAVAKKSPSPEAIAKGQEIKKELKKLEPELLEITKKYDALLKSIPNPPQSDVKVGKNDKENDVIRTWGEPRQFSFEVKDHVTLGEDLEMLDIERASKVSGARFSYLKGDAVRLELALVQYAFDTLSKEGFSLVIPPTLILKESMSGMGYMEHGGDEDMYILEKDNLVLVGTSEQSIGPMHMNETLEGRSLPLRYASFSSCFRREAGTYGKDTRGILRVHQFDKVEMFSFTKPENGDSEHEYLLSLEEKFFQGLGIPYQVIKMCSGDLGLPAARKFDIEAWIPSQGKYREVTSTSTTTDFQSRRLNIKYRQGATSEFVHMLNGTAFAIGRTLIAIMENYQEEDGSIVIPEVLRPYMGKEKISKKEQ